MNDFKEYSAAFQDHQNDLMHYGVKGMKWHKRKPGLKTMPGPQAPRDFSVGNLDPQDKNTYKRASKMARDFSKLSDDQLRKVVDDWSADQDYAEVAKRSNEGTGHHSYISTSSVANTVLSNRNNKKRTGIDKVANRVAKKNKKRQIEKYRAEKAYRRGGN